MGKAYGRMGLFKRPKLVGFTKKIRGLMVVLMVV
jgi:hypothetical protein